MSLTQQQHDALKTELSTDPTARGYHAAGYTAASIWDHFCAPVATSAQPANTSRGLAKIDAVNKVAGFFDVETYMRATAKAGTAANAPKYANALTYIDAGPVDYTLPVASGLMSLLLSDAASGFTTAMQSTLIALCTVTPPPVVTLGPSRRDIVWNYSPGAASVADVQAVMTEMGW